MFWINYKIIIKLPRRQIKKITPKHVIIIFVKKILSHIDSGKMHLNTFLLIILIVSGSLSLTASNSCCKIAKVCGHSRPLIKEGLQLIMLTVWT